MHILLKSLCNINSIFKKNYSNRCLEITSKKEPQSFANHVANITQTKCTT